MSFVSVLSLAFYFLSLVRCWYLLNVSSIFLVMCVFLHMLGYCSWVFVFFVCRVSFSSVTFSIILLINCGFGSYFWPLLICIIVWVSCTLFLLFVNKMTAPVATVLPICVHDSGMNPSEWSCLHVFLSYIVLNFVVSYLHCQVKVVHGSVSFFHLEEPERSFENP